MTPKQQRFCDELLICGNQAEAARRAGYDESTATSKAASWISKYRSESQYPEMWDYVTQKRKDLENEYDVSKGKVLEGMARIATFDPGRLYDENGAFLPVHKMDEDTRLAIVGIEFHSDGTIKKVKAAEKNAALANIAKMLGYNPADKIELNRGDSFLEFLKQTSAASASAKRTTEDISHSLAPELPASNWDNEVDSDWLDLPEKKEVKQGSNPSLSEKDDSKDH
jgi:phage terminase small subunit